MMTKSLHGLLLLPLLLVLLLMLLLVGEVEMQHPFLRPLRATLLRPIFPSPTILGRPNIPQGGFPVRDIILNPSPTRRRIVTGNIPGPGFQTGWTPGSQQGGASGIQRQGDRTTTPGQLNPLPGTVQQPNTTPNLYVPEPTPQRDSVPPTVPEPSAIPTPQGGSAQLLPVQPLQPTTQVPGRGSGASIQHSPAAPAVNNALRDPLCGVMPNPGECRAAFPRYFYDPVTNQCDCFLYGGCGFEGLQSSYSTLTECLHKCLPDNKEEGPTCKNVFREQQTFFADSHEPSNDQRHKPGTVGGVPFPGTNKFSDHDIFHLLADSKANEDNEDFEERRRRSFLLV